MEGFLGGAKRRSSSKAEETSVPEPLTRPPTLKTPRADSSLADVLVVGWHARRLQPSGCSRRWLARTTLLRDDSLLQKGAVVLSSQSRYEGSRRLVIGDDIRFLCSCSCHDLTRPGRSWTRFRNDLASNSLLELNATFTLCSATTRTTDYENLRCSRINVHSLCPTTGLPT